MRTIWRRWRNLRSGWTAALRTSACHKRNIFGWMGLKASHIPGNNNAQGFGANPVSRWSQPLFPVCTVDGYHIFYHFNYVTIRRVMASYAYCGFRVSVGMRSWNRWHFTEKGRSLPTGLVFGGGPKGHPLSFPTVTIAGTPDGWTMTPGMRSSQTPMPDGGFAIATTAEFAFAAPDGATVATYTFTWGMVEHTDDGETSDTPETPIVPDDDVDDNTDTSASDPGDKNTNGDTEANQSDQLPATGTDITGIGAFTLAMLCCGAALGVLLRHRTRN